MITFNKTLILILAASWLLAGCELYNQEEYRELVQVEGYLIANRPLPAVRISTTLPVGEEYSFQNAAISDAVVQITLLDESGSPESVFPYAMGASRGIYFPINNSHTVLPRGRYRIDIEFNSRDEVIRAVTTVPDQIVITNQVKESVVYQSEEQLEIMLAPTVQTQDQNIFVFDSIAENPSPENLTPFYLAAVNDGDAEIEDFLSNSSGLINEANFDVMSDGSISLQYPWIGAAFFGETVVVTNSVDQNVAELIRSQEVQLGGSTLSPGEIPNLRYNIEGGIGVFGSLATDSVITTFLRPAM